MEENVALDTKKQKKFVKSIQGIKKLIKKNDQKPAEDDQPAGNKKADLKNRKRKERGLVYLAHIPHGFYEHQMTQYFKQFGVVTNCRVIRSKRTGNSKGYAFVEFRDPAVALVVADTMNNYLMGKRLIKAVYIPPEKQRRKALRKHWSAAHNPASEKRLKLKKSYNADKDAQGDIKQARKILSTVNKTKKKLSEIGIGYDFFSPVDIPEGLIVVKEEKLEEKLDDPKSDDTNTVKKGKNKKRKQNTDKEETTKAQQVKEEINNTTDKKVVVEATQNKKKGKAQDETKNLHSKNETVKIKSEVKIETKKDKKNKVNKADKESKSKIQPAKKERVNTQVNMKVQEEKQEKLKEVGVKSVENFIKIGEDDSDSSCEFDSDEYEKLIGDDDSDIDSDDEAGSSEDEINDDVDEIEEVPAKKTKMDKTPKILGPLHPNKKKNQLKINKKKNKQVARIVPQDLPVRAKKSKFEKQRNKKPMKKQFKKK